MKPDTTIILAADSKAHDSRRVAADIAKTHRRIRVVTLDEATHHTMPMTPAAALDTELIGALHPQR